MGARPPGPLGLMNTGAAINAGVVNRQRSPGPTSGTVRSNYKALGPILVGRPFRAPGKNAPEPPLSPEAIDFGTVYEDMLFNDKPAKSAPIQKSRLFLLPDDDLKAIGRELMTAVSVGDLKTVALECWDRFNAGTGGTYSNPLLTYAVRRHDKTIECNKNFAARLRKAILACKCDLRNFAPLKIDTYAFDSVEDKACGLGILIHDIWSIKAELKDYVGSYDHATQTGAFYGKLVYTITDDFGLDWADIEVHGDDLFPPIGRLPLDPIPLFAGEGFKAWYILQHYRSSVPFFVEVKLEFGFDDGANRDFISR
jgi:hypothetical protein